MSNFQAGIVLGVSCAALVAIIGLAFFRNVGGGWISMGRAIRDFARGILGIVSVVLAIAGGITAAITGGWVFYFGWLVSYAAGLALYFALRYGVFKLN